MDDAWFARAQMGLSLGFHIVFAAVGVAMPLLMVLAELRWLRRGDPVDLQLAKAWAKGTAVLFAVGAVSGTVLSFELGLLFPRFMEKAGAVIGPAFALEGAAFFVEAIFLGLFLYGWDRLKPAVHVACGAVVALSGLASAALVTLANAWMQAPVGVEVAPDGSWVNLDPIAALWSPAAPLELLHSIVAVYAATGLTVAGVHAWALRRSPGGAGEAFHRRGLGLALALAVPATLAQPVIGHAVGEKTARLQPLKLAAMEAQFRTERRAPARIGGVPDYEARVVRGAIELPGGLSFLATGSFDGEVQGLEAFPREDWPSPLVHYAFQLMVGAGMALAALCAWGAWRRLRDGAWPCGPRTALLWVAAGPLCFAALEAGWIVTEVGRQPWIVQGLMRTRDAITPMPGLAVPCVTFALVYLGLSAATVVVLRGIFAASPGWEAAP
jgi:cytochrome bd ubiquinol oxidase subunit I